MKKTKPSLVVVLLAMVSLVGAQNLSFNVKGGLNLSNLSGDVEDNKVKQAFILALVQITTLLLIWLYSRPFYILLKVLKLI